MSHQSRHTRTYIAIKIDINNTKTQTYRVKNEHCFR